MYTDRTTALKEATTPLLAEQISVGKLMELSRRLHITAVAAGSRHVCENHVSDQVTSTLHSRHCHESNICRVEMRVSFTRTAFVYCYCTSTYLLLEWTLCLSCHWCTHMKWLSSNISSAPSLLTF